MLRSTSHFFRSTANANAVSRRMIYAGLDFKKYPARVTKSFFNKDVVELKSQFPLESVTLTDKIFGSYQQKVLKIKNGTIVPSLINGFYRHQSYKAIDLDLLYSIPQLVWEEFIQVLNPKLVEALNLKKHRHLWNAYNYAIEASSEEIALERAQLIGQHHFVLAILYCSELAMAFAPSRAYNADEWHELKKNCDRFQRTLKERNFFDYQLAQTIHPAFTPRFLHKMAHCSDIAEILRLADALLHYSSTIRIFGSHALHRETYHRLMNMGSLTLAIDKKKTHDAMNWLASSTENPGNFSRSIKFILPLQGLNIGFFFPSRRSWNKGGISEGDNQLIFDYENALFDDLILRQILQKIQEKNIGEEFDLIPPKIYYKFKQLIAISHDLLHINKLQERWHRNIQAIEAAKPVFSKRTWKPLIAATCINGITITPITSENLLKSHGQEMGHCVGGYAKRCVTNESDIFEFLDAQNIKSTLDVWHIEDKIGIQQHRGYRNTFPNEHHAAVATELVRQINEGIIPSNQERLHEKSIHSRMQRDCPYDIYRLDLQEEIYQIYKTQKVLPPILIAGNYQEMLQKSGLGDFIEEVIEAENPSRKMILR